MSELELIKNSDPREILASVVKTHENALHNADQLVKIDRYSYIEIRGAVKSVAYEILDTYRTNIRPFPMTDFESNFRETPKITPSGSLLLQHHLAIPKPDDPKPMTDIEGNIIKLDTLSLRFFNLELPPDEIKFELSSGDKGLAEISWDFWHWYFDNFLPSGNQLMLYYSFSLLECGLIGRHFLTGFMDLRKNLPFEYNVKSAFTSELMDKPTLDKYRYIWRGLRWMCANLLTWDLNKIITPEDLDLPELVKGNTNSDDNSHGLIKI